MIERAELQDSARRALTDAGLKAPRDGSWQLATEMGWLMIPLPEEMGGLGLSGPGLGREALGTIHFEAGRALATAPIIPALLAVQALAGASTMADQASWAERAVSGELITMPLLSGNRLTSDGDTLTGTLAGVADADMASHVLVFASGVAALIPLDAAGVSFTERTLWDESRRLFDVTLSGYTLDPALVLARGALEAEIALRVQADLLFAVAADSLGGAEAMLELTVEYLKTRRQFDRPLAMFQALKHRCADLKTLLVACEALLWSSAANDEATTVQLGGLKERACEVYRLICEEAIQLHGGIGLTEEYYCHHFMKRANLNVQLGGDGDKWREAVGRAKLAELAG
jgi:alkylation response protein AidB-like acyl-CoA dehydrogenase